MRKLRLRAQLARVPLQLRILAAGIAVVAALAAANWVYQAFRKPSELLFALDGALAKTPAQTWLNTGRSSASIPPR